MQKGFEQLVVWREAKALAVSIYRECRKPPLAFDRSLRDQMQRAAISVSSNIAEGSEKESVREELRFLGIAKASAAELRSQIMVGEDIGLVDKTVARQLCGHCRQVGFLLARYMKHKRSHLTD